MMGWQCISWTHIQIICTLLQTDNHTSTSSLSFYNPDALPAAQPTALKPFQCFVVVDWVAGGLYGL